MPTAILPQRDPRQNPLHRGALSGEAPVTSYAYDSDNQLTSVTDALGNGHVVMATTTDGRLTRA